MHQVILVDCTTNDVKILRTAESYESAIAFLHTYINEQYNGYDLWVKCYNDTQNSISVYKYFRVWSKQLMYKIHIVEFDECEKPEGLIKITV